MKWVGIDTGQRLPSWKEQEDDEVNPALSHCTAVDVFLRTVVAVWSLKVNWMFELPAGISFTVDSLIVLLYFNSPWIYSDEESSPSHLSVYDLNPLNSIFLFILLAG